MACDIDKHARSTYFANHNIQPLSDVTDIHPDDIDDYDIVCAGFPCQPFSRCGHGRGFNDSRGTLFYHVMKFADKNPKFIIMENVQGLLKHDNGNTFRTMTAMIEEKGYDYTFKVLKCEKYGIPQKRRRLFILCSRKNLGYDLNDALNFSEHEHSLTLTEFLPEIGTFKRDYGFTLRCGGKSSPINDRHNWDGYFIKQGEEKKWKEWRLTINAGLKLQGFPADFKMIGITTQQWKRLGNTIPVIFTKLIGDVVHKLSNPDM